MLIGSKLILSLTLASAALLGVAGAWLAAGWGSLPARVVLHFSPMKGADLFGTPSDVLTLWVLGFAVAAMNVFLAEVFYDRAREISFLFDGVNVLLMLILLIAIGTIVAVN